MVVPVDKLKYCLDISRHMYVRMPCNGHGRFAIPMSLNLLLVLFFFIPL